MYWIELNGNHGYNNSKYDMSAIFIASGPSFKTNYVKKSMDNIHVYELLCTLSCNITSASNNGSFDAFADILNI